MYLCKFYRWLLVVVYCIMPRQDVGAHDVMMMTVVVLIMTMIQSVLLLVYGSKTLLQQSVLISL